MSVKNQGKTSLENAQQKLYLKSQGETSLEIHSKNIEKAEAKHHSKMHCKNVS